MAVDKPVAVPERKIGSLDVIGVAGGWYLNGAENAAKNQFVAGSNVERTIDGYMKQRRSLQQWLPDTNNSGYQVYPALYNGVVYNFTEDGGKVRYCIEGDPAGWQDCGGANSWSTGTGIKMIFVRAMDCLLIVNGTDKLGYVRLSDKTVVKYVFIANPTGAPTAAATGITASGSYLIYYSYTFTSATGETMTSPILSQAISKPRNQWKADGSEFLTITRPAGNPTGATAWSLYIALAPNGTTIASTDMLLIAGGLDLNTTSVVDNGTLAIDIGKGNPPDTNNTDGMICRFGVESEGRPILYGDITNPYNIWIGGDGDYALDFSPTNGGYRAEVSKGTNYYPASVVGFRNGQGVPSLTILFSNTQGLSKQATLEQQTINYGNQSFVVWGVTEQNYGAAGVASGYGVVNYNGSLTFPSVDGMLSMDTQPQLQNVLATKRISGDIDDYIKRIKTSALKEIVGTAWNNKLMFIIPSYGFDTPQDILVRDLDNAGTWGAPLNIPAQWIGTVSPPTTPGFVYIRQGKKILKLYDSFGTVDYLTSTGTPFASSARGAMLGISDAHNAYQSVVQAVFDVRQLVGTMRCGVDYRNQFGKIKTKYKDVTGAVYAPSSSGGWSDPQQLFSGTSGAPVLAGWVGVPKIDTTATNVTPQDKRVKVIIADLASEVQWWYTTPIGYNAYRLRAISYEGENLGVKPDLR
jgi:hypothetical protein